MFRRRGTGVVVLKAQSKVKKVKKVLVIEDEHMLRQAYEMILKREGFAVVTAENGRDALDVLEHEHPTLILLDMLMPHMDGLQFLRAANLKEKYPDTNVIVFSNLSNTTKVSELIKHGAKKHVLKAELGPTELVELVKEEI